MMRAMATWKTTHARKMYGAARWRQRWCAECRGGAAAQPGRLVEREACLPFGLSV